MKYFDSANNNPKISGILLFSPGIATSIVAIMAGIVKEVRPWLDKVKDSDYSKYSSFPANAAEQFYKLTQVIKKKGTQGDINVPTFIAVSSDDATVLSEETYEFYKAKLATHLKDNQRNRMLIFARKSQMGPNSLCQNWEDSRPKIKCIQSDENPKKVASASHLAIPNSPTNFHYGENGDTPNCTHYTAEVDYRTCESNSTGNVVWAEKNVVEEGNRFRRATFNPKFDTMIMEAKKFMERNNQ